MKQSNHKPANEEVSNRVLEKINEFIPGFHDFFKKVERSKTFGPRAKVIREEIHKKFSSYGERVRKNEARDR